MAIYILVLNLARFMWVVWVWVWRRDYNRGKWFTDVGVHASHLIHLLCIWLHCLFTCSLMLRRNKSIILVIEVTEEIK